MRRLLILLCISLSVFSARADDDHQLVARRASALVASLADEHPRLLLRPIDLPALREFVREALPADAEGRKLAGLLLPPTTPRALIPQPEAVRNGSPEGSQRWRAGYQAANEVGTWAQRYALAWLISEDPAYAREAPHAGCCIWRAGRSIATPTAPTTSCSSSICGR
ncbi:MAG: hypothetical protein CGU28_07450 [Candidatus Dactylopiibacterium carminicum]|uniref:Uncharacterized protein n=1 Tax=Candidatus Dactylopiibacterium carminicum TaxID=857335 RepID=A0A272EVQ3_9RHOO|nr:hypothetical protein [Candidatus Dactylopiibacterium carminicum]KAF7599874.1 hypothetical protein BGI27_05315 [Candidatus Dactylopiibacterium carminicum]PAS94187.1 MAG: hypothetical protein CGU29_05025 [Candidatus Dactylopiibacterium carminicum]PAS96741.1 MAG: hypothetical protein CGU28_07450 [Candidatus Dactylopiibacterium carminicum]PAS99874.1 MAG: hypothetical protein BSR46_05350 [Candidatus Dactylopiibacterium carminicum]